MPGDKRLKPGTTCISTSRLRYLQFFLIVLLAGGILVSSFPLSVHSFSCPVPGRCMYVNPGDSIQQAIYGAAVGGKVFVFSSGFKERVMLYKTFYLFGGGMKTTIVC